MSHKVNIQINIENITAAQAEAIEDMMATWQFLGNVGSSRWTKFYADGDGNFRPRITVGGQRPRRTRFLTDEQKWPKGQSGDYEVDFDRIAWAMREAAP